MSKIHVGGYAGGTSIIDLNEDGSGTLKIRYRKTTDPSVTKRWEEKEFIAVNGGLEAIDKRTMTLADGSRQMTAYPDVVTGTLYLQ
jgi:hypothetical protein